MKKNGYWCVIFFLIIVNAMLGQDTMLEKKVTIQYFDVELQEALEDITKEYQVNFSYSTDRISIHQKVSVDVENAPLSLALEDLLEETDIVYAGIGDQVVLKVDEEKRRLLSERKAVKKIKSKPITPPVFVKRKVIALPVKIKMVSNRTMQLPIPKEEVFFTFEYQPTPFFEQVKEAYDKVFEEDVNDESIAQVTLFGNMGTNSDNHVATTNMVSVNVFWGKNGGVNGVEVGGLVNVTTQEMNGIQVAGIGNRVRGDVQGTQVGGIFNVDKNVVSGVQVAGILNVTKESKGVQAAGLLNVARNIKGVQAAGLLNIASVASTALQVAALGNLAGYDSDGGVQVSALFNVNKGTSNLQIAPFLNVGGKVRGCQIGLINVADTVGGASIGLINFVKKGYNRLEISGADVLYFNAELKLGSRGFYNIFHVGLRPVHPTERHYAFGYGFGRVFDTRKKRCSHNLELLFTQIKNTQQIEVPNAPKRNQLNLLNQLRWTMDYRIGRRTSLFLGPTLNVILSKLVDEDTGKYDLDILPYTIFEKVISAKDPMYLAGWVGVNAGIRF